MGNTVDINPRRLTWAIERAGFKIDDFVTKYPNVLAWLEGIKSPTVKQLEQFAKRVYLPFGYLFLDEYPIEEFPIPFYRTIANADTQPSINLRDTIKLLESRQLWLREYLKENEFEPLDFVNSCTIEDAVIKVAGKLRSILHLKKYWARESQTWEDSLNVLCEKIEDSGVILVFNGVYENNTHRPISVQECRGFVLIDEYAPFMFVNNADSRTAQMFTIVHEFVHVLLGHSAAFDLEGLQPTSDPVEIFCNQVAAEFLVPADALSSVFQDLKDIGTAARFFKVSKIVIARRALDLGYISPKDFLDYYQEYQIAFENQKLNRGSGGNFYATARKRISRTFAAHVERAVNTNQLLYRDAYRLTSLKGDTYKKFFEKAAS